MLAGVPGADQPDPGPTLCGGLSVGRNTILRVIQDGSATGLADLGLLLGAGTACGSCCQELNALLARHVAETAAE